MHSFCTSLARLGTAVTLLTVAWVGVSAAQGSGTGHQLVAQAEVHEAFQFGAKAYRAGDKEAAIIALERAAEGGHVVALWKLGHIYADGDGVAADEPRAFKIFHRIANEFADASPFDDTAPAIANAFVELAGFYADGINNTLEPNRRRASNLLHHAASYFGNTEAQFQLGKLHKSHAEKSSDYTIARRWLGLAAEKGHVEAQALLGELLLSGYADRRYPSRGLAWLIIACDAALGETAIELRPRCNEAYSQASPRHREKAESFADQWRARHAKRRGSS